MSKTGSTVETRLAASRQFATMIVIAFTCMVSTSHATDILFIGSQADATQGADAAVNAFLQETFGAANVTYQQASATNAGDESAFDVLVISSTPGSGDMRGKFQNSTTGIVNWEEAIVDCGDGEFCLSANRPKESAPTHMVELTGAGHPIQGDLPNGVITFATSGGADNVELFYASGNAAGVAEIGHKDGDAGLSFLQYADVGDALLGTGTAGQPDIAAGRRVTFNMTDSTFDFVSSEGQTLFGNSVAWAAVPEPSSFMLTLIGLFTASLTARRRKRSM